MNLKTLRLGSNGLKGWKHEADGLRLTEELQRRVWHHIETRRIAQGLEAETAKRNLARLARLAELRAEAARLKAEAKALTAKADALLEQAAELARQK